MGLIDRVLVPALGRWWRPTLSTWPIACLLREKADQRAKLEAGSFTSEE